MTAIKESDKEYEEYIQRVSKSVYGFGEGKITNINMHNIGIHRLSKTEMDKLGKQLRVVPKKYELDSGNNYRIIHLKLESGFEINFFEENAE